MNSRPEEQKDPVLCGRCWVFGDRIDTDVLAPGHAMDLPPDRQAQHCLEAVEPDFAPRVQDGDLLVAGHSMGIGSSREQAAQVLIELGIKAVLARSAARIFFRNALNLGLPVLICPDLKGVEQHDRLQLNVQTGDIENLTRQQHFTAEPLPPPLYEIWQHGGLMSLLKKRRCKT